jgi:hypothetical protein
MPGMQNVETTISEHNRFACLPCRTGFGDDRSTTKNPRRSIQSFG